MRYLKMYWAAVGGKLFLVPSAASASLGFFGLPVTLTLGNPLFWVAVLSPVAIWSIIGLLNTAVNLQDKIDLVPQYDVSVREAFHHLIVDSKWVLGKDPHAENFYPEIEGVLRDAARNSRLKVWARAAPAMRGGGGFIETLAEIPPREWRGARFDLPTCMDFTSPFACMTKSSGDILEDVRVSQKQFLSIWPRANIFEKWNDPQYKRRKEFYRIESQV